MLLKATVVAIEIPLSSQGALPSPPRAAFIAAVTVGYFNYQFTGSAPEAASRKVHTAFFLYSASAAVQTHAVYVGTLKKIVVLSSK